MTTATSPSANPGWHFFIDRGGTFTDIVAIRPDRRVLTHKLLSDDPERYADAALAGIEFLLTRHASQDRRIASVRMGTTIGTNALLERTGASTVLVITAGFADLLRIGTQQRPDIFALAIELPAMLYREVIEADERIATDGAVIRPLDAERLGSDLRDARNAGAESVAVAFANSYREPRHERLAAELAAAAGFAHVTTSSDVNARIRLLDRGDTAVVDAYLTPVLDRYKRRFHAGLECRPEDGLTFMQSHGGLVDADAFRGCDSVLSGPAGGVVGMAMTARAAGFDDVVGFDMGGTSTDVSVHAGGFERVSVSRVAGFRIARPMLRINTVAAGGGSVLTYRGGRLQVGPASAGADPGPACYRRGGPLTLTDANVCLGLIQPEHFPHVFGASGEEPIDPHAVETGFARMSREIEAAGGPRMTSAELADGCRRIAIAGMAQAIAQISVQRGHDVTRFALACFGGAGGQHACGVADALGIRTIIVHRLSGLLSAYGIGIAERRSIVGAGIHAELSEAVLHDARRELEGLRLALVADYGDAAQITSRAFLRATGSDTLIDVPFSAQTGIDELADAFRSRHRRQFGFATEARTLTLQSIEAESVVPGAVPDIRHEAGSVATADRAFRTIRFAGEWRETAVIERAALSAGERVEGPALIVEAHATIVVEPGWSARLDADGTLILAREADGPNEAVSTQADPIMLEIFNNQFMHVAEQMGAVLEQTAHSVNIKERLDYSCALFDRDGELIANAPHVPVHLGSMGDSVREVMRRFAGPARGAAYMLNTPYAGGTHLPDITVVMPVHPDGSATPAFFVASRAHHADVGGLTPGSMPAMSRDIAEEGILIEPMQILADGRLLEPAIRESLDSGRWPARNPDQNVADLKAQIAACTKGSNEILGLIDRYGKQVVEQYMDHVRANAEACARDALRRLTGGRFTVPMDSGEQIVVAITLDDPSGRARIDFSGTSAMSRGNLNAPASVVRAVVLYSLRTLISERIPLNAGCLAPIEIIIPPDSLLDPVPPAAVAGGNVETSQCIADAVLAAFGAAAASQGTMNNLTFGNSTYQYYETICGGAGAGPGFDGASGVHTHMTNSRLTDIEVLEHRFPVRVRRFALRRGTGGNGRFRGGDGVIRDIEFLAPMTASLLAGRRRTAPFGLAGGGDGACGTDRLVRRDGSIEPITPPAELRVEAGDRIVIETPGGGGYGEPD